MSEAAFDEAAKAALRASVEIVASPAQLQRRIAELEAALRKITEGSPARDYNHESGCPFEAFACSIAYDALPKSTP